MKKGEKMIFTKCDICGKEIKPIDNKTLNKIKNCPEYRIDICNDCLKIARASVIANNNSKFVYKIIVKSVYRGGPMEPKIKEIIMAKNEQEKNKIIDEIKNKEKATNGWGIDIEIIKYIPIEANIIKI
jgi:predicted RNA-binding Zn-ribbon protein involved in translation (DUF1610 family)